LNPELREYLRPWKLASLACGIGLLIAGSYYMPAPDWDIPISLIMANFPASLGLYGLCGAVWLYRGSLAELYAEARQQLLAIRKDA
jgi:hypothetical protein